MFPLCQLLVQAPEHLRTVGPLSEEVPRVDVMGKPSCQTHGRMMRRQHDADQQAQQQSIADVLTVKVATGTRIASCRLKRSGLYG